MVKPRIDIGLIVPILFGCFSAVGLLVILLFGSLNNSREVVQPNDTETPFNYVYLGTEPAVLTLTPEETVPPAVTEAPVEAPAEAPIVSVTPRPPAFFTSLAPAGRPTNTPTNVFLFFDTPTRTPTLVSTSTPGASVYDDTDFRLVYSGNWFVQDDAFGTYQDTLHISNTVGDSVTFTFLGQQVYFTYQAGPSLGAVTVTLDSLGFTLDQSNSTTQSEDWVSGLLIQGTHTVIITHTGGGSVNVDSFTIPYLPTLTPTSNP